MKAIVSEQKYESSVNANASKQTKDSNEEKTQMFTLFVNLNESSILQVYFAKTTRTVLGIPILNLSFELQQSLCFFYLKRQ